MCWCVRLFVDRDKQVVSGIFLEYDGFRNAVCPSCKWSRVRSPYTRNVALEYFVRDRRSQCVSRLLAWAVHVAIIDTGGGDLG